MDAMLCSFSEIFTSGTVKRIVIPKLQRDYAQGRRSASVERVRKKFIAALYDAVTVAPIKLDFVYGDIENGDFVPLDGQQRLTTLFLLHWYAAKKDKIDRVEYEYLKGFKYDTRPDARDFCSSLVDYTPEFGTDALISAQIIDAPWFPLDYLNDPTVSSMLVMLDAIDEAFFDVDGLYAKLVGGAVSFYFGSIKDMGLTDELYIKMNSRGKPLTLFEHFKAELLRELKSVDGELHSRFAKKVDGAWTDLLWSYCDLTDDRTDNDTADEFFLRLFRFACDMIGYGNGECADPALTAVGRDNDVFELVKRFFSENCADAAKNAAILENYFDIWCGELHTKTHIKEFFGRFLSRTHESGKIICKDTDLFEKCIFGYANVSDTSDKERKFSLGEAARLFAFCVYLSERESGKITENDFRRRLRIVDNLIKNSENEVVDSPNNDSGNRMPKILKNIRELISGVDIRDCDGSLGFNQTQFAEETEKSEWTRKYPEFAERLFELEDHPILDGQIGIVGLDNPERFSRFFALFDCDRDAVNCAMLATGDFSQSYRFQLKLGGRNGCGDKPWFDLFHSTKKFAGFENTQAVLCALLDRYENFTDGLLRDIAKNYIDECEKISMFDWRYYYIKYDCFRPMYIEENVNEKSYGGYFGYGKYRRFDGVYDIVAMGTEYKLTNYSYKPFCVAIGVGESDAEDPYNIKLRLHGYTVTSDNEGYTIFDGNGAVLEKIAVPQMGGVDTVDRVLLARREVEKYRCGGQSARQNS